MIEVKSAHILNMLMAHSYSPLVIQIVLAVEKKYGEVCITSAYRDGDPGVHGSTPFCRGIDIRSWIYDDPEEVDAWINEHTVYDKSRPHLKCSVYHDTGRGIHHHLQCHPSTRLDFP